jgi:hypothetical protein
VNHTDPASNLPKEQRQELRRITLETDRICHLVREIAVNQAAAMGMAL